MKDDPRDSPEVRLGDAREFYAHAVRTGNERAREQAEQALRDAKEAIAQEHRLPADAREELERDIARLRARLADRPGPGNTLVQESPEGQLDDDLDVATLAEASLAAAEVAHASGSVGRVGRQAIQEHARVRLAALGEQFAEEMARIEQALAVARSARVESAHRREELEEELRRTDGAGRLAGTGRWLASLAALASAGQIVLAQEAFGVAAPLSSRTSLLIAVSYVIGLGIVAVMVGGLLAAARGPFAQTPRTVAAIAAVLLCGPPIVLATAFEPLSTSGTRDGLLYAGSDLLLAVVGLLFVALCVGLGYQMRDRELSRRHRVESARRESRRAHERYVSLTAQRFALMELYVARGMTAHAEGARMDALLTLQILQRAPQFDKQILGNEYDLPLPFWLRDAHDELRREQGRSNPKDARTASEAYRAMVAAAED